MKGWTILIRSAFFVFRLPANQIKKSCQTIMSDSNSSVSDGPLTSRDKMHELVDL
jgi:hypothetical protein